jgi:hypothetical protein
MISTAFPNLSDETRSRRREQARFDQRGAGNRSIASREKSRLIFIDLTWIKMAVSANVMVPKSPAD